MQKIDKVVPDTSIIIEGLVSSNIIEKKLKTKEIIIHEAVLAELEHQANQGKAIGFLGLDEIKKIRELSEKDKFVVNFVGKRPTSNEIRYASLGEIDALIRESAWNEEATLLTGDKTQARVAEAKGINVVLVAKEKRTEAISIEKYFDKQTMSVHLRENLVASAKRGKPGEWKFMELGKKKLTQEDIKEMSKEIIEEARLRDDGFIEVERKGSTIIQLGTYRIVITRPPFSDGWEITAVRPVKVLSIKDYKLSEKLSQRIEKAEGILIAGAPGHGKTTFAQALAKFYSEKEKIVKTIEAPRDLQLGDEITQYAISHGSAEEVHDILLLSRPDYTVFDEMRNTDDFRLFSDMRLAGVGLVGVIHATQPIDAIQRFIGRIELGVIPHVIDTVIFIRNGQIENIFAVKMVVKVPSGMTEADLARPVVVVTDFETGRLMFEIYSYGEETVVIPASVEKKSPALELAKKEIEREFLKYSSEVRVEMLSDNKAVVFLPEKKIAAVIGAGGKHINSIEKRLGVGIDVEELDQEDVSGKNEVEFEPRIKKKTIEFQLSKEFAQTDVDIYVDKRFIMSARSNNVGLVKIKKRAGLGKSLVEGINQNRVRLMI